MNTKSKLKPLVANISAQRLAELTRSADAADRERAAAVRRCLEARAHPKFPRLHAELTWAAASALGLRSVGLNPAQKQNVIARAMAATDADIKNAAAWKSAQDLWAELHHLGWSPDSELADPSPSNTPSAA